MMVLLCFINCVVFALYSYKVGSLIFKEKINDKKIIITAFIYFTLIYYVILFLLNPVFETYFSCLCSYIFIKKIFKKNNFKTVYTCLFIHLGRVITKIILLLLNSDVIDPVCSYDSYTYEQFVINMVSVAIALIFIYIIKKYIIIFVNNLEKKENKERYLLLIMILTFSISLCLRVNYIDFTFESISEVLILFLITILILNNVGYESKINNMNYHYNEIYEYSNLTDNLLSEYRMKVHENKNQLIMIKSMIQENKNEKEIIKYINKLVKNYSKNGNNNLMSELKYIPIPGIKNFINYKLVQLNSIGSKIELIVSSELNRLDISSFDVDSFQKLTNILGVSLDNIIEACKIDSRKLVSISIFLDNNVVHGIFANSYTGKVDMHKLSEPGYTTKGKEHGYGIPLILKIIEKDERLDWKAEIIDDFFVQHIYVKIIDEKNYQK